MCVSRRGPPPPQVTKSCVTVVYLLSWTEMRHKEAGEKKKASAKPFGSYATESSGLGAKRIWGSKARPKARKLSADHVARQKKKLLHSRVFSI